jgi:nucleotide-binding universal stress UspA family protein
MDERPLIVVGFDGSDGAARAIAGAATLMPDAEAIVVGARELSALGRFVLGSVSSGLVHHATRPVLVVPA